MKLTKIQKNTLEYIKKYFIANKRTPTIRELGEHYGFSNKTIWDRLEALQKKGCIRITSRKARSIEILNYPVVPLEEVLDYLSLCVIDQDLKFRDVLSNIKSGLKNKYGT
jgi:SOS-response transcriptional repressor LexA